MQSRNLAILKPVILLGMTSLTSFLRRVVGLLFGHDVFIAYKFSEAEAYVAALMMLGLQRLHLAPRALTNIPYNSEAEIQTVINRSLLMSSMVLIIGTANALPA